MGLGWVLTVFQQGMVGISSIQTIMDRKGTDDERKSLSANQKEELFKEGIRVDNLNYTYAMYSVNSPIVNFPLITYIPPTKKIMIFKICPRLPSKGITKERIHEIFNVAS